MLLMVEKGIRGGIYQIIHQYVTANNKYMKDYNEIKNFHILCIWTEIIFQKLPIGGLCRS